MFGVRPDRFDHDVEFVGAVDFARYAISHFGPDELGFSEVIEQVNTLRVAVLHGERQGRRSKDFRPIGSAFEGLAGGLLRRVIAQCGACPEPGETTLPVR
jgi:hypothetical protein